MMPPTPAIDAAEFFDPIADMHYRMGTWNNAGAHGKVAAANMAGGDVRYHDIPVNSSMSAWLGSNARIEASSCWRVADCSLTSCPSAGAWPCRSRFARGSER